MKPGFNLLLLLFFIVFYIPASATKYYFSTSGSDSNNGLSSAAPKRSIAAANELMGGGNTILFKRGDVGCIAQGTIKMDNRSDCTLDAYGNVKRPFIAGLALFVHTQTV